jgi:hypothetical protein
MSKTVKVHSEMVAPFTPGPWKVLDGVFPGGGIGIGPELPGIGPHAVVRFNGGESEANAALIAAAPDLLGALDNLLAALDDATGGNALQNAIEDAEKALSAARGA